MSGVKALLREPINEDDNVLNILVTKQRSAKQPYRMLKGQLAVLSTL